MFDKLAPSVTSLRNLETLTLIDKIHDLKRLQNLDRLTQLIIGVHCNCTASLALVCPCNLLQLEISHHSHSAHDGLAIDKVSCHVVARVVDLARPI